MEPERAWASCLHPCRNLETVLHCFDRQEQLSTGKATQSPPTDSHGLDVVYHEPAKMSNVFRSERRTASIMTSLTVEAVAGSSFGLRCFHQNCRVQMS